MKIGIVGLPNVGKSTLFEAITRKKVDISNYPFCTIDPNVGIAPIYDARVDKLTELSNSKKKIYATVEFVDIAGLVKGANEGEGLGNKFLSHVRETDAIVFILRAFKNEKIVNVQKEINPIADKELLEIELVLKDLETVNKRLVSLEKEKRSGDKESLKEHEILSKAKKFMENDKILTEVDFQKEETKALNELQLLSLKPRLFVLNGKDKEISDEIKNTFEKNKWPFIVLDILKEFESSGLNEEERKLLDLEEPALDNLIKKSYELLGLITFLTTGEDETRAWTIKKDSSAPEAGRTIHSDFSDKFIRANIVSYNDFITAGDWAKAREKGLLRTEGRDYIVGDGDVIEFKI